MTRDFVSFVFTPDAVVWSLLALAVWVYLRPASRAARRVLLGVAVFYAIASSLIISHGAGRLLVGDYLPFSAADVPAGATAVVVLGSGSFSARDWDENEFFIPDPFAATRVAEAARVYRMTNADWVISSGGKVVPDDPNVATGVAMRDALVQIGVPASRVLLEIQSRNTYEEAVVVAPMLTSLGVRHTVLVTSDIHMRRSMGAFRARGVEAIPAIARYPFVGRRPAWWVLPSEHGLWMAKGVAHEALGIVYYWARGWWRRAAVQPAD